MRFDPNLQQRADIVREVPLEEVLACFGAQRDNRDRAKWYTVKGPLSLSGTRFYSWQDDRGGGGAIDLVMHLAQLDFLDAVQWLEQHFSAVAAPPDRHPIATRQRKLCLPVRDDRMLDRVCDYLIGIRHLPAPAVDPLIHVGRLYADGRANAVFLLVAGKAQRPVGAELRGTGPRNWRGMARGTSKDRGYFWVGKPGATELVLCEAAIDAISCHLLYPDHICISTSGVRTNPPWLKPLLDRHYLIYCGYDADDAGDAAAAGLIARHPTIQRLRPTAHDWNDLLR